MSILPKDLTGPATKREPDPDLEEALLQKVSRTFAFTIPQMEGELRRVVTHAYLLCRILDTIEDEPGISFDEKKSFSQRFLHILKGIEDPRQFSIDLGEALTEHTIEGEHELVQQFPKVLDTYFTLEPSTRESLFRCIDIMAEGMLAFSEMPHSSGLRSLTELKQYCYHVAGVIGEMLTDLFFTYSDIDLRTKTRMSQFAVPFGLALQMTNILKDMWEDLEQGVCWLPKDIFLAHGFNLTELTPSIHVESFEKGIKEMVRITYKELQKALSYTLLIPNSETGIRKFCFWNLGMALLTVRKIYKNPRYRSGEEVKISRRSVANVVFFSSLFARSNFLLKQLFKFWGRGLHA